MFFVWAGLCYTKVDWFTRLVELGNGSGDLIGGLVTGGVEGPCLPPGREGKQEGGGYSNSLLPGGEGGRWKVPVTHGVHCISYRKSSVSVKMCNTLA